MAVSQVVAGALSVAGLLVAVWLVARGARGSSRVLGLGGVVLLALGAIGRLGREWIRERFLGRGDTETVVTVLAADIALAGVLTGAGLLLVVRAVVVAGRAPTTR